MLRRVELIRFILLCLLAVAYITSLSAEFYFIGRVRPIIDVAIKHSTYKVPDEISNHRMMVRKLRILTAAFGLFMLSIMFVFAFISKRLTRELIEAKNAALESSKLKSEFIANISHEIRTPVSIILGMVELQELEKLPFSAEIGISTRQLLAVVEDLLNFSKLEMGKTKLFLEDYDPMTLLQSVLKEGVSGQDISTELIFPSYKEGIKYVGDVGKIRQVLMNLLINADKFTETGTIVLTCLPDEGLLKFWVTDTGIGLSKEDQTRLFVPFSQVDGSISRKYGGTGLGLAICAKLVGLMDGEIGVFSDGLNKGSTFWFFVPLVQSK